MISKGYPFRVETAKIMEVIRVESCWGDGTDGDPHRTVFLYFDKAGHLLAVDDSQHPHERLLHDRAVGM